MFMTVLNYLLARLREPSTWAGLAVFFGFFGIDQDTLDRITHNMPAILAGVTSLVAIFKPSPPIPPTNKEPS